MQGSVPPLSLSRSLPLPCTLYRRALSSTFSRFSYFSCFVCCTFFYQATMTSSRSMSIEPNAKICALCSYKLVIRAHVQPSNQERSASAEFFIYSRMSWLGLNCVCEWQGISYKHFTSMWCESVGATTPTCMFQTSYLQYSSHRYSGCIIWNYRHILPHIRTICARPLIIKIIFKGFPYLISTYYKQKNITTI